MNYLSLSITEIANLIKDKKVTSVELTNAALSQIEKTKDLNANITVCSSHALAAAKAADDRIKSGALTSPLAGIPIAIKDNICVKGIKTTCASKMLENFIPPYNATVVEKLNASGAVIISKTNMDEFAMGSTGNTSIYGAVKNPINKEYSAGGSSGGSAAAVKAGQVFAAVGTDTGGSVRLPACLNALVGLKPTYGLVSRYGVVAAVSSMDQVGALTRTVKDSAIMLNAMAGYDERDSMSVDLPKVDYLKAIKGKIDGLKIGISKELLNGLNSEISSKLQDIVHFYEKNGAKIIEVNIPYQKEVSSVYNIIACAEISSNMGKYDGIRYGHRAQSFSDLNDLYLKSRTEGFGYEVKRRILLGNLMLSGDNYEKYFTKAQKVRTLIKQAYEEIYKSCDILLAPSLRCSALKLGKDCSANLLDEFLMASNITGMPSIVFPIGNDNGGMPIGVQLMANAFCEDKLFNAADFFETKGGCKN